MGVEQEISKNTTATLSYVGSRGTHLAIATQVNQLPPVAAANNPFGPGMPITAQFCQTNQINPQNPFDPGGFFTLPNGNPLTYSANPSAVLALIAACDGHAGDNKPGDRF